MEVQIWHLPMASLWKCTSYEHPWEGGNFPLKWAEVVVSWGILLCFMEAQIYRLFYYFQPKLYHRKKSFLFEVRPLLLLLLPWPSSRSCSGQSCSWRRDFCCSVWRSKLRQRTFQLSHISHSVVNFATQMADFFFLLFF